MFETDSSAEFLGLSTDPNRKGQDFANSGKSAYGFDGRVEELSGSASAQQLGSSLMDDPWLGDMSCSDALATGQSKKQDALGSDLITGFQAGDNGSGEDGAGTFANGNTTAFEINEVNSRLAHSRYDRDEVTGDRYYSNNCKNYYTTNSADEHWRFDRGDARWNAIDVGEVVYRSDAIVNGFAGFTTQGVRDKNDWYKFTVGKSGDIDISLTGLTQNIGVSLYGSSGNLIDWSDKSGSQSESILENLSKGNYYARVYSYKQQPWGHGQTAYKLNISRKADKLENFWQNMLTDSSVENAALNAIKTNSYLSRNDVIGIIKSAGDYGSVSATEHIDLKKFWNKAINTTNVAQDIKVLSEKVIFSDTSNQWYTGSDSIRDNLGNLSAGTNKTDLNLLIGKHFLGTDRPAIGMAGATYTRAGGTLFKSGVSANDVDQGSTGTCYFLSALAGTANDKPGMISNMFKSNGDGTWSARFHTNGKVDYVTVDRWMPTNAAGRYIHADCGTNGKQLVAGNNELWVALAEKAYAQVNESGNIGQATATNYYGIGNQQNSGISWGSTAAGIRHVTGLNTSSNTIGSFNQASLSALVNSNKVVSYGVGGHARSIVNYNNATGNFTIKDPYGQILLRNYTQLSNWGGWVYNSTT